jgi:hypothetical protein
MMKEKKMDFQLLHQRIERFKISPVLTPFTSNRSGILIHIVPTGIENISQTALTDEIKSEKFKYFDSLLNNDPSGNNPYILRYSNEEGMVIYNELLYVNWLHNGAIEIFDHNLKIDKNPYMNNDMVIDFDWVIRKATIYITKGVSFYLDNFTSSKSYCITITLMNVKDINIQSVANNLYTLNSPIETQELRFLPIEGIRTIDGLDQKISQRLLDDFRNRFHGKGL